MTISRSPQCTTYAQLHEHMAHVYRICEGTSVSVASCVRRNGGPPQLWNNHPAFDRRAEEYEFALGLVKDVPVFRYDVLYDQDGNKWIAIGGFLGIEGGKLRLVRDANDQSAGAILSAESLSWNPPRRTIKIGEIEVPAPNNTPTWEYPANLLRIGERTFYFDELKDRITTENAIIAAFEGRKP